MDLKQLQRFVTVAERQSFASAAKALNLSQPALTRSIQMLEEAVDADLFERGPRGVVLTPAGEELLTHAKAIVNERDRALAAIATAKRDSTHRVTVGSLPLLSSHVLGPPMLQFCDDFPDVEVRIVEDSVSRLIDRMREADIDFCFGSTDSTTDLSGTSFEPLIDQDAVIVARSQHPLHARTDLTFGDLCDQRWIVLDSADMRLMWRAAFIRRELPVPKSVIWAQSWDVMHRALLASNSVMACGSFALAGELASGSLIEIRTAPEAFRATAGLLTPTHRSCSRLANAFIALIRAHCSKVNQSARPGNPPRKT